MKELKSNKDFEMLFNGLLKAADVTAAELNQYLNGELDFPKAGFFQLKDKTFQPEPKWNEEWGIYFTPNLYINIDAMNDVKKPLTSEQAKVWAEMKEYRIPTDAELKLIAAEVAAVNSSLCDVNMHPHLLSQDVLQTCWSQESLKAAKKDEKRRLIVVEYQENLPDILPFLAKLKPQFKP